MHYHNLFDKKDLDMQVFQKKLPKSERLWAPPSENLQTRLSWNK